MDFGQALDVVALLNLTPAQHAALKKTGKMGAIIRQLVDRWMKRRDKN